MRRDNPRVGAGFVSIWETTLLRNDLFLLHSGKMLPSESPPDSGDGGAVRSEHNVPRRLH